MALDALCLTALVEELKPILLGAKIDKIHQPARDEVVVALRGGGENVKLLLSANMNYPRLQLTKLVWENPATPPMFCMLLRKHLVGGRIVSVEQPSMERLVELKLEVLDELGDRVERTLVLECMGRNANLILLDGDRRITDAIRRVEGDLATGKRQVLPGLFYRPPEPKFGIPPLLQRELLFLGQEGDLAPHIYQMEEEIKEGQGKPYLILKNGEAVDFSFRPILQYGAESELKEYPTFSLLLDDFYKDRQSNERTKQKGQDFIKTVTSARDRTARKLNNQRKELEKAENREILREKGDILTSNLHLMKKGMTTLTTANFYDPEYQDITIQLDPLLTPQQNAAKYYKNYTKAKTAEEMLTLQIAKGETDLSYLESVLQSLTQCEGERDLLEIRQELTQGGYVKRTGKVKGREKLISGKPMEFRSSAGLRILVGKNNNQNDTLTTKTAGRGDIWFHTQKIHGSHVILFLDGGEADLESLTQAAMLAAYYSQAKGGNQVPVDYTPVKFVKKPNGSRPGMVIYTTYQTAYVTPDEELVKRLRVK